MISQKISKNIFWILFELKNINLDNIGIFEKKVIFWKKVIEETFEIFEKFEKKKKLLEMKKNEKSDRRDIWNIWEIWTKKLLEMKKKMTWNNTRDLTPFIQSHKTLHKERGSGHIHTC